MISERELDAADQPIINASNEVLAGMKTVYLWKKSNREISRN